jgi:hypothetical protein
LIRCRNHDRRRGAIISFLTRLLVSLYLIESGLLLTVAPWMSWWHRNYFVDRSPVLQSFILSRVGWLLVIGVGMLTLIGGLVDLYGTFAGRPKRQVSPSAAQDL